MVYFANVAVNRLYLHTALQGFAENSGGAFVLIYLLHSGLAAPQVLCIFAGLLLLRLTFRLGVIPAARRFGVRTTLILGAVLVTAAYAALAFVDGGLLYVALYVGLAACGEAFYWSSYHAAMASLGDAHARGAQTSTVQLIYSLSAVLGPLVGGFGLALFGPKAAFLTSGAFQLLSALPLLGLPEMPVAPQPRLDAQAAQTATNVYFGDGVLAAGQYYTWSLALFLTLGEKFQAYGLAQAVAALLGAVMALGLGRLIDAGHPKRSAVIGLGAMALAALLKALGYQTPNAAMIALGAGSLVGPIYGAAFNARIYTLAKQSGDALRFHVRGEGGWDLGAATSSLACAALIQLGAGFGWAMGLAISGVAFTSWVMARSFQKGEPSLRV